jgi:hypothetical protein
MKTKRELDLIYLCPSSPSVATVFFYLEHRARSPTDTHVANLLSPRKLERIVARMDADGKEKNDASARQFSLYLFPLIRVIRGSNQL